MIDVKEKRVQRNYFFLVTLGLSIPGAIVVGYIFRIPMRFIIIYVMFAALAFGWLALWTHANRNADGTEWWQDDNASSWRGY